MSNPGRTSRWPQLAVAALVFLAIAGFFAWQHYYPVTAAPGWQSSVHLDDVAMVSALDIGGDGALYVTQEFNKGRGKLLRREPDGTLRQVLDGLDKPDGLARFRDTLVISQEGGELPVLGLRDGKPAELFTGYSIEGIAADARHIYAIEDRKTGGRLLQFEPDTGQLTVLRSGLLEGEGVAVCPDGRLFYAEKATGRVMQYRSGQDDPVVQGDLNRPGFVRCDAEGLWIAEDATHGARLLLLDGHGVLHVVLSHLRSAQTVLPIGEGRYLVAEQGRNRILEFRRIKSDETNPR